MSPNAEEDGHARSHCRFCQGWPVWGRSFRIRRETAAGRARAYVEPDPARPGVGHRGRRRFGHCHSGRRPAVDDANSHAVRHGGAAGLRRLGPRPRRGAVGRRGRPGRPRPGRDRRRRGGCRGGQAAVAEQDAGDPAAAADARLLPPSTTGRRRPCGGGWRRPSRRPPTPWRGRSTRSGRGRRADRPPGRPGCRSTGTCTSSPARPGSPAAARPPGPAGSSWTTPARGRWATATSSPPSGRWSTATRTGCRNWSARRPTARTASRSRRPGR